MKTCRQCGAPDNPLVDSASLVDDGTGKLVPSVTHFVVPEIQFLLGGRNITLREKLQGWHQRIFQTRQAIERDTCMDCLNSNYIRRQLNAETKRKALALEKDQNGEENFYLALSDADGNY